MPTVRTPRAPIAAACALLLAAAAGCQSINNLNILSDADEINLGTDFAQELEKQLEFVNDPMVVAYVDSLGQALARNSKRNNIPYHIKVVNSDEVNAFAIPGGFLYVNRALIQEAESESELAGVMGHEIGHVVGRHGAKQMTRQYGLGFLLSLALGPDPAFWQRTAGELLATGALLKYGREAELEADRLGVEETYATRIDPGGIVTFFEKLMALHEREPSGFEQLFSTHPPTTERIELAQQHIAGLPPQGGLAGDSPRFRAVKARVNQLYPRPAK